MGKKKEIESINYSSETMREVEESIKNKEPVVIHYNNETGDWLYAVSLVKDTAFWLDAFLTKKGAENFCRKNKLPITDYIRDTK
jgi:hypothetical protein